jgi:LPXTG-site transpeptidase (sortase) family protein
MEDGAKMMRPDSPLDRPSIRRRGGLLSFVMALTILGGIAAFAIPAVAAPVSSSQLGEMPTTGGLRPGPVGMNPAAIRKQGVRPTAIKIPDAQVDAEVETTEIVNGVMQNPSGPWVVAWYKETGKLGEDGNVVLSGHLDYWDVGQAVFFHLGELEEGDKIEVTGADDTVFTFEVEWVKNYTIADLGPDGIKEIVGATDDEQLTLITCGGPFDYQTGEYLERMVVRANRVTT